MRWLDGITDSIREFEQTPRDSEGQEGWYAVAMGSQRVSHHLLTEQQQPDKV